MIKIAEAIQFVRTQLNVSQRAAAEELGLSYVQLSNIETGKSKPSAATLEKFRDVWGIDLYMVAVTMFSDDADTPAALKKPLRDLKNAWSKEIDLVIQRRKLEIETGCSTSKPKSD